MENKIFEVKIDDLNNEELGINAISDVKSPAVRSLFVALSEQPQESMQVKLMNEDKRLLIGLVLIPNIPIEREHNGESIDIIFGKETIRHASQLYMKRNKQHNTTLQHEGEVEGVTTVETWIVEDSKADKTALYGINAPIGAWAIVKHVDNEDYWLNEVKTGNVKGFSIEGNFIPHLRTDLKSELTDDEKLEEVKKLLNIE